MYCLVCPLGDEGGDYAGPSPCPYALDLAHGFLSLALIPWIVSRDQWEPAYLYRANVFEPHKNVTITATIAVIAPATAGSQCEPWFGNTAKLTLDVA